MVAGIRSRRPVSPAVSPITPASAFAPGPVCLGFAVVGLFRGLSRVPARCHSYSPADGLRAETLPVRYAYPAPLSLQSRILIFFHLLTNLSFLFFSDGSVRPCVVLFFSVLLLNLRFSVSISHMCETKKNKKELWQFLKFLIFPPYPLLFVTSHTLYMYESLV